MATSSHAQNYTTQKNKKPKFRGEREVQSKKEEKPKEEKKEIEKRDVRLGVIASTGTTAGRGSRSFGSDTASAPGDKPNPVSAGIQAVGGKCSLTLKNNDAEAGFSVRAKVTGTNKKGSSNFRKSVSARLTPGKSVVKKFSCPGVESTQVELTSAVQF